MHVLPSLTTTTKPVTGWIQKWLQMAPSGFSHPVQSSSSSTDRQICNKNKCLSMNIARDKETNRAPSRTTGYCSTDASLKQYRASGYTISPHHKPHLSMSLLGKANYEQLWELSFYKCLWSPQNRGEITKFKNPQLGVLQDGRL